MVGGHVGTIGHIGQVGASVVTVTGVVGQDSQGEQVGAVVGGITVGQSLETIKYCVVI